MAPKKNMSKPDVDFQNAGTQTKSRLMSLPPELRNRIFFFAVADTQVFVSKDMVLKTRALRGRYRSVYGYHLTRQPGILLACKQIYCEAIKVFYANASFTFTGCDHLERWARKALLKNKTCIAQAQLNMRYKPYETCAIVIAEVDFFRSRAGLKSLSFGHNSEGVYRLDKSGNFAFSFR